MGEGSDMSNDKSNEPLTLDIALALHAKFSAEHPSETVDQISRRVSQRTWPKGKSAPEVRAAHCRIIGDMEAIAQARTFKAATFLVMADHGAYSDRRQWPVKAYLTYGAAAACVDRLSAHFAKHAPPPGYGSYEPVPVPADDPAADGLGREAPDYYVTVIPMGD